ncbi:beta-ketoacyl synthase [Flavobacterium salilacus subsp. salilacus]|uniref:beta-ketoacyl synthase N-terminal-like domain-containing protein n=1 Tax=Flavobacterium TaxID=237 RepID=UPI0010758367|nr:MULTISPECIES: beta-ketoacyl synthase N-terminal-like domain-containing protein [Flavobacterium]KAF2518879.1 beta-ketoacyl synthase [Flavobacterium salilacus subsp. salilacus]MBE1614961.1 beta-ketoacyl synthase [Flavobacterium sp. SaA2.13]
MFTPVSITAIASFSPLGNHPDIVWENYLNNASLIQLMPFGTKKAFGVALPESLQQEVQALRASAPKYQNLDNSVLYALLASRAAIKTAGWKRGDNFGVNIGSSRGTTALFEQYHSEFLQTGTSSTQASPATTLGNIASWVAQDLKAAGPDISHSITCSTALHAVLNGVAWLRSGMATKFLVGGSEAPLTPFTIAQMQAMKIYASQEAEYPCRALDLNKKTNSMVLGEGAVSACLELGRKENAVGYIEGIGYATEELKHSISISANADCLQKSMRMALQDTDINEVDAIVLHAPGTVKGDLSEYNAIKEIFGETLPLLTTNKWKTGHTFGASGLLSLELALMMVQHNTFIGVPYIPAQESKKPIKKVLVNAVGFGGNAVSVLVGK